MVQVGFLALFAGIVIMVAALDAGAGPQIVTSVTVSAGTDEQSGEVGGIQDTVTNLGVSIGTALAGAVLIVVLTSSFLAGVQNNPAVPEEVAAQAQLELAGGIRFRSDKDLQTALEKAGMPAKTADARIAGLRSSLSVLALIALIALFATRWIPARQPFAGPGGPSP